MYDRRKTLIHCNHNYNSSINPEEFDSIAKNIIDDVKAMVGGLLSPIRRENTTGYAEIRQVIALSKVGKVAGCMVTEGVIRRKANARLIRNDIVIYDGKLGALKRF